MTVTLHEINARQKHLRQEILERECLLATLEVLRKHVAAHGSSKSIDLSALFPAWCPTHETASPARQVTLLASAPAALPPPAPPEPYIHPDLQPFTNRHGGNTMVVQWAIERLTGDYTLQEIRALLTREGCIIESAEISVVLSRLKRRGKITAIEGGSGRRPSIFRNSPASSGESTLAGA